MHYQKLVTGWWSQPKVEQIECSLPNINRLIAKNKIQTTDSKQNKKIMASVPLAEKNMLFHMPGYLGLTYGGNFNKTLGKNFQKIIVHKIDTNYCH